MIRISFFLLFLLLSVRVFSQDIEEVIRAKPLTWTGAVGVNFGSFPVRGGEAATNFHYGMFGNFILRFYNTFELPIYFSYNQFGLNIDKPFYQLGISPKYKWVQLHLGHRSMHFNNYTLAGHTFLGAGIEINPGKFRFATMTGRLREPILIDANTGQELINPQFRRNGIGAKIGVGSHSNFIDLMVFRAADAPESITNWETPLYQNSISGTTGGFTPAENVIVGLTTRLTLFSKILFNLEGGASVYTSDITSDSLTRITRFFTPRKSSGFSWAGKTSLSFPLGPIRMMAAYERVMPEYFTMGAYSIVNDMENITISPSGSFWSGRFHFSGMVGSQRNNLLETRSETTRRLISNLNMMIAPQPHYGLNFSYSNFIFNQQPQAILVSDSVLIKQVNSTLSVMPYYNFVKDTISTQSIQLAFISQQVNDQNPVTRDFGSMKSTMITSNYTYSLNKGYSFSAGLNHTRISSAMLTNTLSGMSIGANRSIAEKGMNLGLTSHYNKTMVDGEKDGRIINIGANAGISMAERHQVRLNMNWMKSQSDRFESYSDVIFQVGYTFRIR